jgi:ArsR family transcriptional regulator, arsenate/arsenite/antimonite-responsive transcriptional repressor
MNAGHASPSLAPGQFDRIAKALADPRRFALLQTIASSRHDCAYQKLCGLFPVTKATISHHLKELVSAGLVETERDGQFVNARAVPGMVEAYARELMRRAGGQQHTTQPARASGATGHGAAASRHASDE